VPNDPQYQHPRRTTAMRWVAGAREREREANNLKPKRSLEGLRPWFQRERDDDLP